MSIIIFCVAALLVIVVSLVIYTNYKSRQILRKFPPIGEFETVDGAKVHFVDQPADVNNAPTVIFLHGASSNLRDAYFAYSDRLAGKARCLFFDRPGHGWSERGSDAMDQIEGQADLLASFLDQRGIDKVILHGHSFGGAIALAFALRHPNRVHGLILSASVIYPWPGGINWYYEWAAHPLFGFLFSQTVLVPQGLRTIDCVTRKVYWPSTIPNGYEQAAGAEMVLVPRRFRYNSRDIVKLRPSIEAQCSSYPEIDVPVKILNGKKDQVLLPWVHSERLVEVLSNAELINLDEGGHMPHQSHVEIVLKAIDDIWKEASNPHAAIGADKGNPEHVGGTRRAERYAS